MSSFGIFQGVGNSAGQVAWIVQCFTSPPTQYRLYGVTRGQLPQRAGLPGLNGGAAAGQVRPTILQSCHIFVEHLRPGLFSSADSVTEK